MFIKQIIIQGFKSYRNQTVIEPFSGQHNVIVGRNGSGKSNFFAAIRFVLSDAYTNMGREERQALLHEGTGAATMSAYVEVIFDNSDNRFPTGKDELVLRRTIGLKKDEYSLDKKGATKTDVMNLLESAGFSRSNPYFIVPQGRITSLTNAKDTERLQLLKEVAGTRVYESRRQESVKIIQETESKRKNIEELLTFIEERLSELEEEKEELKLFQELDRRRRCIEYTIYSREQTDINGALEEMEDEHRQVVSGSNQQQQDFNDREMQVQQLEREIKTLEQNFDTLSAEKRQLSHEMESQIKISAQMELHIKEYENNSEATTANQLQNEQEKLRLEKEIQKQEEELVLVEQLLHECEAQERQLRSELDQTEQQRQALYAKQGRSGQFQNRAQRDEWIQQEIGAITQSMAIQIASAKTLEQELEALKQQLTQAREAVQQSKDQEKARKSELEQLAVDLAALKSERDILTDSRKELWREDARMDSTVNNLRDDLRKAERSLGGSMDKNTSAGLSAVERIAKSLNLDGVYGPLYKLFDVEDQYDVCVNVVAGTSLFHVVVDNEHTVSRILDELNKEKAGRVTFMPLSRLKHQEVRYPDATDAIPMIKKLQFDPKYALAFNQVFGKALICRNLEIASTYSRSFHLNGVTLDGDRVDRKGALTGGYHDPRQSRLNSAKNIKQTSTKYEAALERCQTIKSEISTLDRKITEHLNRIQQTEIKRRQLTDGRDMRLMELRTLATEETSLRDAVDQKTNNQYKAQSEVDAFSAQIQSLKDELSSEMVQTLSADERRILDGLVRRSVELKEQIGKVAAERTVRSTRRSIAEITLSSNLRPRMEEVQNKVESTSSITSLEDLHSQQRQLAALQRGIKSLADRIQEIENEQEESQKTIVDQNQQLDKIQAGQQEEMKLVRQQQKDAEKYVSRRNLLLSKKEECMKKIRDLGILPEEAFEKFKSTVTSKLLKQLHKVIEELRKYSHVNKKAFEQYTNFTKQRDTLNQRKDELDQSQQAIQELIETLDQRKDEAIERTFKQVAKNFAEVFCKLVPAGKGQLIMQRKLPGAVAAAGGKKSRGQQQQQQQLIDEDSESEDDSNAAGDGQPASRIDNYTGIAIQVSFNSKLNEGLRMQQLSGGQKSLVALTLIFAIQQCDPAPFYLFDEIDANLDTAHRTAVAAMIHSLSQGAQFITTTFRPEMLANADKFYGVSFQNKLSMINAITKDEALDFVEQEQAH